VEKRKTFVSGLYTLQSETSAGFAAMLGSLIQQGMPAAEAVRYLERIATVSAPAASTAAARISASDRASLVIVGDSSKFIDKLRALRPDVEVIKADELDLEAAALRGD
jgi:zinc protease